MQPTLILCLHLALLASAAVAAQPPRTWDGRHSIEQIEVTVVYFVPSNGSPLPDWRDRVSYFSRRIEQFHQREYQGQSTLTTKIHDEPFRSSRSTQQLRAGDGNHTFFQTLREVDARLGFARGPRKAFPILLVLSDMNWRELEDFYRLRPAEQGLEFEGQLINDRHFPGAASGGARATYLADRGVGWGLVSADGWRVPYSGTDCVVYHEGVGHTVGLPHPQQGNGSVMSLGQYRGWINESWLDDDQKVHLGWTPPPEPITRDDLFSTFTALPDPLVPEPNESVELNLTWPAAAQLRSARVRFQTELLGPWIDAPKVASGAPPQRVPLSTFDRTTPVSYRVDATLDDGQEVELWGYFQVRTAPNALPLPRDSVGHPVSSRHPPRWEETIDLLELVDVDRQTINGTWKRDGSAIESNKQFGARLELPFEPPAEYQMTYTVRPLDAPNGLILGQRLGGRRFVVLVNYATAPDQLARTAIENVDGMNVGNHTTLSANLLTQGRPSTIVTTVRQDSVTVTCDGREVIHWQGKPEQLSLSDYWRTPRKNAMLIGAYDCRYRFERITLTPITGKARNLTGGSSANDSGEE